MLLYVTSFANMDGFKLLSTLILLLSCGNSSFLSTNFVKKTTCYNLTTLNNRSPIENFREGYECESKKTLKELRSKFFYKAIENL